MIIAENIQKETTLTVEDLDQGDTFVILARDFNNPLIMTDNEFFVDLVEGEAYDVYDFANMPIRKIDFRLIQK